MCGTNLFGRHDLWLGIAHRRCQYRQPAGLCAVQYWYLARVLATGTGKPLTVRFDVVNIFDTIYEIRDGSGIGVFAPQYGPRRGYFIGVSKKI